MEYQALAYSLGSRPLSLLCAIESALVTGEPCTLVDVHYDEG